MEENKVSSGSVSVVGFLGVAFVVLKLTGVIGWSWWWVTAPFWGGVVLSLVVLMIIVVLAVIVE